MRLGISSTRTGNRLGRTMPMLRPPEMTKRGSRRGAGEKGAASCRACQRIERSEPLAKGRQSVNQLPIDRRRGTKTTAAHGPR